MEAGLAQLCQQYMPGDPKRFALLGDRYAEEIVRVRAEIDSFIQLDAAKGPYIQVGDLVKLRPGVDVPGVERDKIYKVVTVAYLKRPIAFLEGIYDEIRFQFLEKVADASPPGGQKEP